MRPASLPAFGSTRSSSGGSVSRPTLAIPHSGRAKIRIRTTAFALACFLIGATYSVKVNLVGEATLAEFLLPLLCR